MFTTLILARRMDGLFVLRDCAQRFTRQPLKQNMGRKVKQLHGAALLKKLIATSLVKKFPAVCETRNLVTVSTAA